MSGLREDLVPVVPGCYQVVSHGRQVVSDGCDVGLERGHRIGEVSEVRSNNGTGAVGRCSASISAGSGVAGMPPPSWPPGWLTGGAAWMRTFSTQAPRSLR